MRPLIAPRLTALAIFCASSIGCGGAGSEEAAATRRQAPVEVPAAGSILLVTLDTTRADVLGFAGGPAPTPNLDGLADRGLVFDQAYTTAPMTLPAHASMLTGLLPAEHGVRENARVLGPDHPRLADRLRAAGFATAAFVSGYPLARGFGLAAGFEVYDDRFVADSTSAGVTSAERRADVTTARAATYLHTLAGRPALVWVHLFDPHEPYAPPEAFRGRTGDPYLDEIAFLDDQLGGLLEAFWAHAGDGPWTVVVAGDHGEGRGDHGEMLHGNLLYQGVMRVPLLVVGHDIPPRRRADPVSVLQVFDTVLDRAGLDGPRTLLSPRGEPVLGEAMKPFLQYGWQPQVMAVHGTVKAIRASGLEVYDVVADPGERTDLSRQDGVLDRALREALRAYPFVPERPSATPQSLSAEDRARLASLGYAGWDGTPTALRDNAPDPRAMVGLFADLDRGSGLFVAGRYAEALPIFERVHEDDPNNLMVAVRLAVAASVLGRDEVAERYFGRARTIDPSSADVRHYEGLHALRRGDLDAAAVLLESALATMPDRVATLDGLVRVREAQLRPFEAVALAERAVALAPSADRWARLGSLRMALGETAAAIVAFEACRDFGGDHFDHGLELGVLYLASRRIADARDALDAVPASHPARPMVLFKRAQVAVLLDEVDRVERVRRAWAVADATTRPLIEREALFRDLAWR